MVTVSINGSDATIDEASDLQRLVFGRTHQYLDVELSGSDNGPFLTALINGPDGWLMYMRESGDTGFHSVNPDYEGNPEAKIDFVLGNGQKDQYPASWVLPRDIVVAVLKEFWLEPRKSAMVQWAAAT